LAQAIARALDHPEEIAEIARKLLDRVQASFSVESMVDGVLSAYQAALETLAKGGRR